MAVADVSALFHIDNCYSASITGALRVDMVDGAAYAWTDPLDDAEVALYEATGGVFRFNNVDDAVLEGSLVLNSVGPSIYVYGSSNLTVGGGVDIEFGQVVIVATPLATLDGSIINDIVVINGDASAAKLIGCNFQQDVYVADPGLIVGNRFGMKTVGTGGGLPNQLLAVGISQIYGDGATQYQACVISGNTFVAQNSDDAGDACVLRIEGVDALSAGPLVIGNAFVVSPLENSNTTTFDVIRVINIDRTVIQANRVATIDAGQTGRFGRNMLRIDANCDGTLYTNNDLRNHPLGTGVTWAAKVSDSGTNSVTGWGNFT